MLGSGSRHVCCCHGQLQDENSKISIIECEWWPGLGLRGAPWPTVLTYPQTAAHTWSIYRKASWYTIHHSHAGKAEPGEPAEVAREKRGQPPAGWGTLGLGPAPGVSHTMAARRVFSSSVAFAFVPWAEAEKGR